MVTILYLLTFVIIPVHFFMPSKNSRTVENKGKGCDKIKSKIKLMNAFYASVLNVKSTSKAGSGVKTRAY